MIIKELVKSIIGKEKVSAAKGQVLHWLFSAKLKKAGKLKIEGKRLTLYRKISAGDYHVFRGYYDIHYMSSDQSRFLVHRLPLNALTNKETKIETGYYDLKSDRYVNVSSSSAWCWQQGSRLRWHPLYADEILFNDVLPESNGYCTRIVNIKTGRDTAIIPYPMYDIANDFSYGISIDFGRLQRMRHGYGYNYYPDYSEGELQPSDDGLWIVDLSTNHAELLFSVRQLAETAGLEQEKECYLNHISISPDHRHFMFFLISCTAGIAGWETVLFVSDKEGKELSILERKDRVSHYCWLDNQTLMVTCRRKDNTEYYCTFDISDKSKSVLQIRNLDVDGHPNVIGSEEIITDTYPGDFSLQKIRIFKLSDQHADTELSIYHDSRLRGEQRCDLHPSVEASGEFAAIDTTYEDGKRCVLVFKVKG